MTTKNQLCNCRNKDCTRNCDTYQVCIRNNDLFINSPKGKKFECCKNNKGDKGQKGDTATKGQKGDPGTKGQKGDPSEKGQKGDPGETGQKGDAGQKGDPSEKGQKGDPGQKGDSGGIACQIIDVPTNTVAQVCDPLIPSGLVVRNIDFMNLVAAFAPNIPVLGAGTRITFDAAPGDGSFRAGTVDGTQWNPFNVGLTSFAVGTNTIAFGQNSHAEGNTTTASGPNSHAEGLNTTASGDNSHAEGFATTASGPNSHAEGNTTTASGDNSHAEGLNTNASGSQAHAEGLNTIASGLNAHVEGQNSTASARAAHAEGNSTNATGSAAHSEGFSTTASGDRSHAEGSNTLASGERSHAEGSNTIASGDQSHAEGSTTVASGERSHAEGSDTTASGDQSHAEGSNTVASGERSHAEGSNTTASGNRSHAEGSNTTASGNRAHSEGLNTTASGDQSHAEGNNTVASSGEAHAEGLRTIASGLNSHAEGFTTTASALDSHAEGGFTIASGREAHAEGFNTMATVDQAHAEGNGTIASGARAHAEGFTTTASGVNSHAEGNGTIADVEGVHIMGILGRSLPAPLNRYSWQLAGGTLAPVAPGDGISAIIRTTTFGTPQPVSEMVCDVYTVGPADYAEYFEWLDGNPNNEDRVGYFVSLSNDKIEIATASYDVIGIVSGTPGITADAAELYWSGTNKTDDFGRTIKEYYYIPSHILSEYNINFTNKYQDMNHMIADVLIHITPIINEMVNTAINKKLDMITAIGIKKLNQILTPEEISHPTINISEKILNAIVSQLQNLQMLPCNVTSELYNPSLSSTYTPRSKRKEWTTVGLMGKIYTRDNGECIVGSKCDCTNGIAVPGTTWRIMERKTPNVIRILYR